MKKSYFLIPLLSLTVILGFVSCLETGGNKESGTLPAVVNYNIKEMVPSLLTAAGELSAPSLSISDLRRGDCILAHFTLDWDHQPSSDSLVRATEISYIPIDQSYAEIQREFDENEPVIPAADILPILSISPQAYHPILNGKFFFLFDHTVPVKQEMDYILIAKPAANTSDETVTVYITGQKNNKPDGAETAIQNLYAIDMLNVIGELGQETTIRENGIDRRVQQVKIKIKYCSGVNENNIPVYRDYSYGNTFTLSVYIN